MKEKLKTIHDAFDPIITHEISGRAAALTNAQEALAADPENEELQAAVDAAQKQVDDFGGADPLTYSHTVFALIQLRGTDFIRRVGTPVSEQLAGVWDMEDDDLDVQDEATVIDFILDLLA